MKCFVVPKKPILQRNFKVEKTNFCDQTYIITLQSLRTTYTVIVIYCMVQVFSAVSELCICVNIAQSRSKFLILQLFAGFINCMSQYN